MSSSNLGKVPPPRPWRFDPECRPLLPTRHRSKIVAITDTQVKNRSHTIIENSKIWNMYLIVRNFLEIFFTYSRFCFVKSLTKSAFFLGFQRSAWFHKPPDITFQLCIAAIPIRHHGDTRGKFGRYLLSDRITPTHNSHLMHIFWI
jgi:hypothetical protein